jgi:hypothetical protein
MKLEVIERHCYHVTDAELASDLRQALKDGDTERLSELIDFLNDIGGLAATCDTTHDVLDCSEVKR